MTTPRSVPVALHVGGVTRGAFLLRSALTAGALYGGAAVAPLVREALAQDETGGNDVDIVGFLLTLERAEAAFFAQALERGGLAGDVQALAEQLRGDEDEHVDALTETLNDLGAEPPPEPDFDFAEALGDERSFLDYARVLEDAAVGAYNGAVALILDRDVAATAASIVQVEGRHAALVRLRLGDDPTESAFDESFDQAEFRGVIEPYEKG